MSHGKVIVGTAADPQKFSDILAQLNLVPPVLIKPNWGTVECYTEADVLDWVLSAIPGEKIVIESHGWARNQETLLGAPQGGLTKANLRKGDAWFLAHSGSDKVLARHGVEYLNLTEEVWAGRVADPELDPPGRWKSNTRRCSSTSSTPKCRRGCTRCAAARCSA